MNTDEHGYSGAKGRGGGKMRGRVVKAVKRMEMEGVSDFLSAEQIEFCHGPPFARYVAEVLAAKRALPAFRIDGAGHVVDRIDPHLAAVIICDRGAGKPAVGLDEVEAGMRAIEDEGVTDFVVRYGVEIVGLVSQVPGEEPVIVIGAIKPAEGVVVAVM